MFMNHTGNVQRLGNLKSSLLRTKAVESISAFFNGKQPNRLSSSNDGDRVNDEKFEKQSTSSSTTPDENGAIKRAPAGQTSPEKHQKNVNSKMFIEVNLFGPKDARLPLPGNVGFASGYLKKKPMKPAVEPKPAIEKEFKLITDHDPSFSDCLTTTIEFNLNHYETNEDRQNRVVENAVYNHKDDLSLERNQEKFKNLFFVKVFSSTQFLLSDIKQIFPKECLFEKDFVIISVYKNPFSKIVDVNLKEEFVTLANSISDTLNKGGCWTNFLEPDCKRSYADMVSCLSLDSDEERFVNYGVEVENYGNCKLLKHINHAKLFIGSVFTSAKLESVELNRVLNLLTMF